MVENKKTQRVLSLYQRLSRGEIINKSEEALAFGVDEKSIQRDIDEIRRFLDQEYGDSTVQNAVVYSNEFKGYLLVEVANDDKLSKEEALAVIKVLLDSRCLPKDDMERLVNKVIYRAVPSDERQKVLDLVKNELFYYVELRHGKNLVDVIWKVGEAICNKNFADITYTRINDKKTVNRRIKPVGLIFNEFYFYLIAYIDDKELDKKLGGKLAFPTIYRLDRLDDFRILGEKYKIPYSSRFEEGEFRKRIQFMFAGDLKKVRFKFFGPDLDSILDRLPTADILEETDEYRLIEAEVYGDGIDMWLRSQGDRIEVISENDWR